VVADRLGSIGHFYPYGQEKPSATTNGTEKFTGYFRDSETGFDYADQRFHNPGTGRFLTVDAGAPKLVDPGSWNRYAYVGGDPINSTDRLGMFSSAEDCTADPDGCVAEDSSGTPLYCTVVTSNPFVAQPLPPICYTSVAYVPPQAEDPTITCEDTLDPGFNPALVGKDLLSTVVMRILNENSFNDRGHRSYQAGNTSGHGTGPFITFDSLSAEDLAIASVIVNLGMTPYSGFNGTLASAEQNGNFANANAIANKRWLGGSPDSDQCQDIREAIDAAETVLNSGSQLPMYYNQWRGVLQGGAVYPPPACGFQIDNTKFFNGNNQPCNP